VLPEDENIFPIQQAKSPGLPLIISLSRTFHS